MGSDASISRSEVNRPSSASTASTTERPRSVSSNRPCRLAVRSPSPTPRSMARSKAGSNCNAGDRGASRPSNAASSAFRDPVLSTAEFRTCNCSRVAACPRQRPTMRSIRGMRHSGRMSGGTDVGRLVNVKPARPLPPLLPPDTVVARHGALPVPKSRGHSASQSAAVPHAMSDASLSERNIRLSLSVSW